MSDRCVGDVEVDSRRRVLLGRASKKEHTRYRVEEDDMGVLTLTPLITVPVTALDDLLRKAVTQADERKVRARPDKTRT